MWTLFFNFSTFDTYQYSSQRACLLSLSIVSVSKDGATFRDGPQCEKGVLAYAGVRYIFLGEHHAVAGHVSPWATIFITNRSAVRGWQSNTSCVSMFPTWRPSERARGRASRRARSFFPRWIRRSVRSAYTVRAFREARSSWTIINQARVRSS